MRKFLSPIIQCRVGYINVARAYDAYVILIGKSLVDPSKMIETKQKEQQKTKQRTQYRKYSNIQFLAPFITSAMEDSV